jgi:hypothetical protein
MQIGNKFRCYPTQIQKQTLLNWIGCQRYIYNAKVREDQYFRRFARKSLSHTHLPPERGGFPHTTLKIDYFAQFFNIVATKYKNMLN